MEIGRKVLQLESPGGWVEWFGVLSGTPTAIVTGQCTFRQTPGEQYTVYCIQYTSRAVAGGIKQREKRARFVSVALTVENVVPSPQATAFIELFEWKKTRCGPDINHGHQSKCW